MNKWKKTAKIQKKRDFPKGQPHFLTLKIVYGKRSRSFPANILTQSYILHLTLMSKWRGEEILGVILQITLILYILYIIYII